jgi:hypothetical protein
LGALLLGAGWHYGLDETIPIGGNMEPEQPEDAKPEEKKPEQGIVPEKLKEFAEYAGPALASWLQLRVQDARDHFDVIMRLTDRRIGFYERVMIFDAGVLAFSITFIGYLVGHPHLSRAWLLFVYASWMCLLVSMAAAWIHNVISYNITTRLAQRFMAVSHNSLTHTLSVIHSRTEAARGNSPTQPLNQAIETLIKYEQDVTNEAEELVKKANPYVKVANLATLSGIVLFAIFAGVAVFKALR